MKNQKLSKEKESTSVLDVNSEKQKLRIKELEDEILSLKTAEVTLKEINNRYSETINSISEGIVYQLADGSIQSCNQSAEQILGLSREQMTGWTSLDPRWKSIHESGEDFPDDAHPILQTIITGENSSNVIMGIRHSTGELRWISISCRAIFQNNQKSPIGAVGTFVDITDYKKVISKLQANGIEQNEIMESMVDAVITINEKGTCLSYNKSAQSLFGYKNQEILGQNINILMPELEATGHDGYLKNYIKSGKAKILGIGREVVGKDKNNRTFPMHLSIAEISRDDNDERRFIGNCHDLTTRKQQEEQIRRTQKMDALGKLTGGIAHDFNNMLGVINGYSSLLLNSLDSKSKNLKYAKEIKTASDRGVTLTQKLLSYSKVVPHELKKININNHLETKQDLLQNLLTVNIKLGFEFYNELWSTYIDVNDFDDAVINLAINAKHAMSENLSGGNLTLQTSNYILSDIEAEKIGLVEGDYILLNISDNGCGMSQSTIDSIFDPFFSTKGEKGTGLGLSQVYGFAKRCGGTIVVKSEINKGTNFDIYFPRYLNDDVGEVEDIPGYVEDTIGTASILVVDDEPAMLNVVDILLREKGYAVHCASRASTALEILKSHKMDLILTDIIMPEMNGVELALTVKELYPDTKVQFMSGYSDGLLDMISADAYQHIVHKPFDENVLYKAIRKNLDG